jgi:RNA polymerase sigma-70 factor (ECF subfamily)
MPTIDGPDEELLEGYTATGELRWLDELFGRHMARVRNIVFPIVLHEADADDITQEVFVRAARGLARFRRTSQFSTWLHRIAVNTAVDFVRRRKRTPMCDGMDAVEDHPGNGVLPSGGLVTRETDHAIGAALRELSPELRAAITLTAIEGLSTTEAAAACNCLAATLYWRVHKARKILREKLGTHRS